MATDDLPLTISWFSTAMPDGPANGDPEATTWGRFVDVFRYRREGDKDGPGFVPARFRLEADGRQVRRLKENVLARAAMALDIERNKKTGELPPTPDEAAARARAISLAALVYTSHSHHPPDDIRYRIVIPLSAEIAPELPAPEVMADVLGLAGVLDRSKIGATSLFYLPSCPQGAADIHQEIIIPGAAVGADWIIKRSRALFDARQAEADHITTEAHAEAAARRAAKIAAGFNPEDSLIELLRSHFDLAEVLLAHGYARRGTRYRHPNSVSGSFGADVKCFGGIERVFSHNGADPLHRDNLPNWCSVTAVDVVDVVTILDYSGDRPRALRELAQKFGLTKTTKSAERRAVACLLFQLVQAGVSQEAIEAAAFAEGERVGLSPTEVCSVAKWVAITLEEAA